MSLITEQFIKDNGPKRASVTAKVFKFGKTGANMRVTGAMIWQMVEVA
jgi:hypothetical protein